MSEAPKDRFDKEILSLAGFDASVPEGAENCFDREEAIHLGRSILALASAPQASQPPQGAKPWCSCEPTRCEGIGRCRWHAMNYSPLAAPPQGASSLLPADWADQVEQRLLTWRQRFVNKSGNQLALDDMMGQESIDDLIDFVCAPLAASPLPAPQEPSRLVAEVSSVVGAGPNDVGIRWRGGMVSVGTLLYAATQEPADPMDWPLPCDVKVGNGTHRKGTSLRTLVARMQMLHREAFGDPPSPEQQARNLAELQGYAAPAPQEPVLKCIECDGPVEWRCPACKIRSPLYAAPAHDSTRGSP